VQLDRRDNYMALCSAVDTESLQSALACAPEVQRTLTRSLLILASELVASAEQDAEQDTAAVLCASLSIAPPDMLPRVHHLRAAAAMLSGDIQLALDCVDKAASSLEALAAGGAAQGLEVGQTQITIHADHSDHDAFAQQKQACAVLRLKLLMEVWSMNTHHNANEHAARERQS
jgi:hypothetical protein